MPERDSTSPPPRKTPLRRKLALAAGALVCFALLAEGAIRVRHYAKFGAFGPVHDFVLHPDSGLMIPPPGRVTKTLSINSLGFRGPEIEQPKPERRLRLAFLGGSTTFCAEASGEAATWPARVAAALGAECAEHSLDYVNAGVGGYRLAKMRVNLEKRVAPLDPDVIFIYEATNDLTFDSRELAQERGVYTGHADDSSWLAEHSLAWYLLEKNLLLRQRQRVALAGERRLQVEPGELSRRFRAELSSLVDEARARAKLVVLLTFAPHVRRSQSEAERFAACNTSLYYMPYMTPQALLEGFDEFNAVIREVAAQKDVLLVDVAEAVPGDSLHYNDSVHFKDRGCEVLAEAVARAVSSSPRFQALCAASGR